MLSRLVRYKLNVLLISFLFLTLLKAQDTIPIDEPQAHYRGLSLIQSSNGTGVGGFWEVATPHSNRFGFHVNLLMFRGKNDYPIYDYYTGLTYERSDKRRLTLLPVYATYKQMLFVDQIANNFRPYLSLSAGPTIAFDPPNVPEFSTRWKKMQVKYTLSIRTGLGLDFLYGPQTIVSLFMGYNYLHFLQKIDAAPNERYAAKKNFSGLILSISVGKKY